MKTQTAKVIVKAILPLTFAPPGKIGIKPKKLFVNIKKKDDIKHKANEQMQTCRGSDVSNNIMIDSVLFLKDTKAISQL